MRLRRLSSTRFIAHRGATSDKTLFVRCGELVLTQTDGGVPIVKFLMCYVISPSGPFGVPDREHVVIPGRADTYYGPAIHTSTGRPVSHGTLPRYRDENSKIQLDLVLSNNRARLEDNYLTLEVAADDAATALEVANALVTEFLGHLSLSQARAYQKELVVFEDEDGSVYPVPRYVTFVTVTTYNLESMRHDILEAQESMGIADSRLSRAIHYFQLAHLLFERRSQIADVASPLHTDTIGAAFLCLWKAVTVILGDPARRQDRYQKRYRQLGYADDVKARLDELKTLRDDFDVAHYSLEPQRVKEVENAYGRSEQFVASVIRSYRSLVRSGGGLDED